jgi:hypothetical protein
MIDGAGISRVNPIVCTVLRAGFPLEVFSPEGGTSDIRGVWAHCEDDEHRLMAVTGATTTCKFVFFGFVFAISVVLQSFEILPFFPDNFQNLYATFDATTTSSKTGVFIHGP